MSYLRCECHEGDVPHTGPATHKRPGRRCTRTATVRLRRTDRVTPIWFSYCEACAQAIEAWPLTVVEREKR